MKLTETERIILENTDERYKYIARDETGILVLYVHEPKNIEIQVNGLVIILKNRSLHSTIYSKVFSGKRKNRYDLEMTKENLYYEINKRLKKHHTMIQLMLMI